MAAAAAAAAAVAELLLPRQKQLLLPRQKQLLLPRHKQLLLLPVVVVAVAQPLFQARVLAVDPLEQVLERLVMSRLEALEALELKEALI